METIENKQNDLEKQLDNLSKLVEINGIINSTLNINKLLSIIMEMIKNIMNTEASSLLLYDEDMEELVFKVALGEAGDELSEKYRVKLGQGIAGWVAFHKEDTIVNDVYSDERFDPMYDKSTGFRTRSILCSPLLFKGKLLGVIQAINPIGRAGFDEEDLNIFRIFSNQAALAVQNAIFFQRAIEEERLTGEINAAKDIHSDLASPINCIEENISVAAVSASAREVGGSFHYFRKNREDFFNLVLLNLNSKGIPGAMKAAIISGIIKTLFELEISQPEDVLSKIKALCYDEFDGKNEPSIFVAAVDTFKRIFSFVNYGGCYPLLLRNGVVYYLRFSQKATQIKTRRISLQSGDIYIVFSSAFGEIKNPDGKRLNVNIIANYLKKFHGVESPSDIINNLMNFIEDFSGSREMQKDLSILVFKV